MNKENQITRNFQSTLKRSDKGSRQVEGIAIVFDSPSQPIGNYTEIIDRSAVTEETIKNSDIFAYLNHDENRGVLARSRYGEGSLKLSLQNDGLHYSFESPKTQLGDELLSYLERGEITTSSFCFNTPADGSGEKWERDNNGNLICHITNIYRLFDVSPVFEPAYLASDCHLRKYNEILKIDENLESLKKEIDFL